jgi:HEAT repeat protein
MKAVAVLQIVLLLAVQPAPAQTPTSAEVARLLVDFSNVRYSWEQTDVARRLVAIGDEAAVPSIALYLDTPDRRRRCNAAFVLAGLGDERGTPILIRELEDTGFEDRAAEGGPWTGPAPTPEGILRRQVISDRYFAALLLGELRAKAAVPALMAATADATINYRAAMSLGEIGDASALPALRRMLEQFPEQRIWAGYALAALGDASGFEVLESALADPEWGRRRQAVWGLGKTLDRRAVPILLGAIHDEHANVRVSVAQELARIGDPTALPALRAALSDDEVTQVNAPTSLAAEARKAIEQIEQGAR